MMTLSTGLLPLNEMLQLMTAHLAAKFTTDTFTGGSGGSVCLLFFLHICCENKEEKERGEREREREVGKDRRENSDRLDRKRLTYRV